MRKSTFAIIAVVFCLVLVGCAQTKSIDFPFESFEVESVEMFYFIDPVDAEKRVVTDQEDIADIFKTLQSVSLQDKKTEPVAGNSVISFRFYLSDGSPFEVVYSAVAVKSGCIVTTDSEKEYFTSADIGGMWDKYDYEVVHAGEDELPVLPEQRSLETDKSQSYEQEPNNEQSSESSEWDRIPMVMVDGKLYYDTGEESSLGERRCGLMDGQITSSVDGSEIPIKDNQSNFGTGFGYQYGLDDTIEILMNEKWIVFESRDSEEVEAPE